MNLDFKWTYLIYKSSKDGNDENEHAIQNNQSIISPNLSCPKPIQKTYA